MSTLKTYCLLINTERFTRCPTHLEVIQQMLQEDSDLEEFICCLRHGWMNTCIIHAEESLELPVTSNPNTKNVRTNIITKHGSLLWR